MRALKTFALLPAVCTLALLQACGSSSTGDDSAGTGATSGSPTSSSGAPGVSGSPGSSGSPSSSAGSSSGGSSGAATSGGDSSGGDSAAGAGGKKGKGGATGAGGTAGDTGTSGSAGTSGSSGSSGAAGAGGTAGAAGSSSGGMMDLGPHVMTWYSFQDNTPVNSSQSASGNVLHAYVSVALPFRFIVGCGGDAANKPPKGTTCGPLKFGDKLYLEYLKGKKMPNGMLHNGWVEVDDFCGDNGGDGYCFQKISGQTAKLPNVDLYIGDFPKSGMAPSSGDCSGPAGSGQELTNLSVGDPGSAFVTNWGGLDLGSGKCGDYTSAETQQGGLKGGCWDYTPPANNYCMDCKIGVDCTSN